MTNAQDSTQRSPLLNSISRPCGTEETVIYGHAQLLSPYSRGESMSVSATSLSNGYLSPRNIPVLSPKYVKQLVSPSNRQLIPNMTMPLLSPCNGQSLSPDILQTANTKRVSSFSSRQLFTDNISQHIPTANRPLSTNNSGQILSPNNINQPAQFVDHQRYRLDQQNQLTHLAEVIGTRRIYTLDQDCLGQIPNTWLSPSPPAHITPTIANSSNSQSVTHRFSFPPTSETAYGQQNYQGTGQVVHKLHNTNLSRPKFPPSPTLNPSKSGIQMMSSNVCNDGAELEQNLKVNHAQNYNGLPVYDIKSPPRIPHTRPTTENSMVKSTDIATGRNMVAGQWTISGHANLAAVNGTEGVFVHKFTGKESTQTGTVSGSVQQKQTVSAQPQYQVTSMATQSRQIGQYKLSAPLGKQIHLKTPGQDAQSGHLHQQMSNLQDQVNDLNVPPLPSPELLQSMMANNSPSKFVVMKMTESDKYVILSPEKSSTSEMVYKPMGSMKLPPGKYRLHTVNANPLTTLVDKGETNQQKINITFPNDGTQRAPKSKSEGKLLKKKHSIKSKYAKEKKECKREGKGKQQSNKMSSTKKKNTKMEKKENTENEKDKKTKATEKNPTARDKKSKPKKTDGAKAKAPKVKDQKAKNSKVKDQKAKDSKVKDQKAKGKKKKPKSETLEKTTEGKKEDTICRVLSPCQKFCQAVLIFQNKAGRTIHTACNPVIFFTGGQFSESEDTPEVEHPVYLLTSDNNNQILAIMSEAFSPGQFLLSSQRPITLKDKFLSSDLQANDANNCPFQYRLYQAVLSPYHFTITSPIKGHKVILISQYKDFPIDTLPRGPQDDLEIGERPNLISDVIDTWDQSYDITTMTPCTHPLYKVINEMLKKKVEAPPKTCKFKLRVQLFDSRRKKRQKICDEI